MDVSYVSELSAQEVEDRRFSTLDLCSPEAFTIIVGSHEEWYERCAAVKRMFLRYRLKIDVFAAGTDFDFVQESHLVLFNEKGQFGRGGGVLVRPDQHILLDLRSDISAEEIASQMRQHLGL